jgi:hypothetical protein
MVCSLKAPNQALQANPLARAGAVTSSQHVYEVRPRKDHRGVDLISDALPFGRLWYNGRKPSGKTNSLNVQLHLVISKPVKTPRSSTRNHLLSHVRLPAAIPLMAAAAAMACVTLNAPGPVSAQRLNPSITPFPTHSPSPLPSPSPTP